MNLDIPSPEVRGRLCNREKIMVRLYIANTTKQTQIVCYRLDYGKTGELKDANRRFEPAKQQDIPPGRQVQIGGDFHANQIADIVDQLSKYGMVGVVDVPRLRGKVAPLVYNTDRPVPSSVMEKVRDSNASVLIQQGQERRKKAAVATNELVQNTVANSFAEKGIDAEPADRTDVVIEQQEQSEAGERRVEEGFHVVPGPQTRRKPGRPKKT